MAAPAIAAESALPWGVAYRGATAEALEKARKEEGEKYLPSVFNPQTVTSRGKLAVAKDRVSKGPDGKPGFGIYYEVHGSGPVKVVFIMGLNNSCFGWLPQVETLNEDPTYSCLVLDNRGYGNSDVPKGAYKTSDMALDTLEVLDHLGWTEKRTVHVVGVSMGGMISLELASRVPQRIASLCLISTTAGTGTNLPPRKGLYGIVRLLGGRILGTDDDLFRINKLIEVLFPASFLAEKDSETGKTRQQLFQEMFTWRFQFTKRQEMAGALGQIAAAMTHKVTNDRLHKINASIPKIAIVTGDEDNLVNPRNSQHLRKQIPRAEFIEIKNGGHALQVQIPERLNKILLAAFKEGRERSQAGGW